MEAREKEWEKDPKLPANIHAIVKIAAAKRNPAQKAELTKAFRGSIAEIQPLQAKANDLNAKLAAVQPVPTPIMRELPDKQKRTTKIHIRGDWLNQGQKVEPGVPVAFHPLAKDAPANRLGLAKWLVAPENPLTARVAVNRFWEQIFGVGFVDTPEDFGIRSTPPLHGDLLDWLAAEFEGPMAWDVKKLLKAIVSNT